MMSDPRSARSRSAAKVAPKAAAASQKNAAPQRNRTSQNLRTNLNPKRKAPATGSPRRRAATPPPTEPRRQGRFARAFSITLTLVPIVGLLAAVVWIAQITTARDDLGSSDFSTAPTTDVLAETPISSPGTVSAPGGQTAAALGIADTVDAAWLDSVVTSTSIPRRALAAYAGASLRLAQEQPDCHLGWTTLAGIGQIESGHASHAGAVLQADGRTDRAIRGPALDGVQFMAIADTDGGVWDGDTEWDRAVGPVQFIPSTWSTWGADGNGDGVTDPNQIDDAVLAAGRYLCHSGDLSSVDGWRTAIFSYNHDNAYVDSVADAANRYARLS